MRQATKTQSVEKLDPVWERIREEAQDIARHLGVSLEAM